MCTPRLWRPCVFQLASRAVGLYLQPSACFRPALSPPPLRSFKDRLRQIALFEAGGLLLITPPFSWASGVSVVDSVGLLAILALIAALWNGAFNTAFDWVEGRLTGRTADQRPWPRRVVHALGFESGLVLISLPVVVGWTGMGWGEAFMADLGLALAYALYAFIFNLGYDRLYPIPASPRVG